MTFRTSTIFSSAPNMFITQKSESDNKSRLFSRKKTLILSNFFTVPSCPQHLHQNLYDFWRPRIQLGCRKLIQFNIIGNSRLLCCWNLFETIFCLLSARQRAKTWDFCSITKGTKKVESLHWAEATQHRRSLQKNKSLSLVVASFDFEVDVSFGSFVNVNKGNFQ